MRSATRVSAPARGPRRDRRPARRHPGDAVRGPRLSAGPSALSGTQGSTALLPGRRSDLVWLAWRPCRSSRSAPCSCPVRGCRCRSSNRATSSCSRTCSTGRTSVSPSSASSRSARASRSATTACAPCTPSAAAPCSPRPRPSRASASSSSRRAPTASALDAIDESAGTPYTTARVTWLPEPDGDAATVVARGPAARRARRLRRGHRDRARAPHRRPFPGVCRVGHREPRRGRPPAPPREQRHRVASAPRPPARPA